MRDKCTYDEFTGRSVLRQKGIERLSAPSKNNKNNIHQIGTA